MARASKGKFKITYELDDGYAGGSRPHYTSISAGDLEGNETEEDLQEMFWAEIQRHFEENTHPHSGQEAEFIEWAKSVMRDAEV